MSDIYDQVSTSHPVLDDGPEQTPDTSSSTVSDKAGVAKEQADQLKDTVAESGAQVAGTAKDEAGKVLGEAKTQAKDLFTQTQGELKDQAATQQKRVAAGLRSVSDELGSMADNSEGGVVAADLVQQAASRAGSIATWLEDRDPGSLLSEVRAYASRKPGTFIGIAAVAGLVAGRLTKGLISNASDEKAAAETPTTSAVPSTYAGPAYVDPLVVPTAYPVTETSTVLGSESFDEQALPAETPVTETYLGDRA